jgi:ABC-type Zn2+ transport system substrate-binding protein/surface adhesin
MKLSRSPHWVLLSLLSALAMAPLGASAQSNQVAPVARTKPVIDHAQPQKQSSVDMHGAAHEHQQHNKAHQHEHTHEAAPHHSPHRAL